MRKTLFKGHLFTSILLDEVLVLFATLKNAQSLELKKPKQTE
jgi:hypothetical protein